MPSTDRPLVSNFIDEAHGCRNDLPLDQNENN
jgi:hypothetical protein